MITPVGAVTPLGAGVPLSEENIARSTLVEFTSLEVENDLPEGSVDGAGTLSPASRVPLGWVGGVLWPLLSVALIPTIWRRLGARDASVEPERQGSPLGLPGGTSEPSSHTLITRHLGVGSTTAVTGTFSLGPYQGGTTTPPMMIPSGYP